MTEEIKPCPHCGKTKSVVMVMNDANDHYRYVCSADSGRRLEGCGSSSGYKPTKREALALWNKRTVELSEKDIRAFQEIYNLSFPSHGNDYTMSFDLPESEIDGFMMEFKCKNILDTKEENNLTRAQACKVLEIYSMGLYAATQEERRKFKV